MGGLRSPDLYMVMGSIVDIWLGLLAFSHRVLTRSLLWWLDHCSVFWGVLAVNGHHLPIRLIITISRLLEFPTIPLLYVAVPLWPRSYHRSQPNSEPIPLPSPSFLQFNFLVLWLKYHWLHAPIQLNRWTSRCDLAFKLWYELVTRHCRL